MLDKEKDKEGLTVLGRTLKEIEAGLERAFEEFLQEYPDISREEAQKAWKAAGAPSRVEPGVAPRDLLCSRTCQCSCGYCSMVPLGAHSLPSLIQTSTKIIYVVVFAIVLIMSVTKLCRVENLGACE